MRKAHVDHGVIQRARLSSILPPAFRNHIELTKLTEPAYRVFVFRHGQSDVVRLGAVERALHKTDVLDVPLLAVGFQFTNEARAALLESQAEILELREFFWSESSYSWIQRETGKHDVLGHFDHGAIERARLASTLPPAFRNHIELTKLIEPAYRVLMFSESDVVRLRAVERALRDTDASDVPVLALGSEFTNEARAALLESQVAILELRESVRSESSYAWVQKETGKQS